MQPYASSSADQGVLELAHAGAAVLGRTGRVHEADLPGLLEDVHREAGVSRSHSAAMGMISSRVKRRAVSTSAFCSSESEKSIMDPPLLLSRLSASGAHE